MCVRDRPREPGASGFSRGPPTARLPRSRAQGTVQCEGGRRGWRTRVWSWRQEEDPSAGSRRVRQTRTNDAEGPEVEMAAGSGGLQSTDVGGVSGGECPSPLAVLAGRPGTLTLGLPLSACSGSWSCKSRLHGNPATEAPLAPPTSRARKPSCFPGSEDLADQFGRALRKRLASASAPGSSSPPRSTVSAQGDRHPTWAASRTTSFTGWDTVLISGMRRLSSGTVPFSIA